MRNITTKNFPIESLDLGKIILLLHRMALKQLKYYVEYKSIVKVVSENQVKLYNILLLIESLLLKPVPKAHKGEFIIA